MKKKTALFLDLNLGSSSAAVNRFTPARFKPNTELETLQILKRTANDKKLSGIFINTSGFSGGRAYLWELQKAVEICRSSGKKVIAYFDNADLDLYCFLSAADKIVMDEAALLSFLGYSWGRFFVKETLDKLGVGFRELRYLDYKSANETFSRTSISDADREQYGAYLDQIFDLTKNTILKNRPMPGENFETLLKEAVLLSPAEAKSRGLVDVIGREEAIRETIRAMEFGEPEKGSVHFITAGNSAHSLFSLDRKAPSYSPVRARFRAPEIAVVHARGNTDLDQGMNARNIAQIIRRQAERSRVKAMVIRIDSPGGSAVAADYIAEAISEAKKEKPVVVSMGQVAASGGYWAAMTASHISASPYTLTGSIGVIAGWFFDNGFNTKLGLGFDVLTRGEHADLGAGIILPKRDLSENEEEQFRRCLLDLYDGFVKKAAKNRNIKEEELEPLARGRVYSGLHAQSLRLIDSLGGYNDALETARRLAEIPAARKIRIREYPKTKFLENMAARFLSPARISLNGYDLTAGPWGDLYYRLSHNGRALPVLPLIWD